MSCATCPIARCAGRCACTVDGRDVVKHQESAYCPHPSGPRFGTSEAPADWAAVPVVQVGVPQPRPAPEPYDWTVTGPELWAELHRRPLESQGNDAAWLEAFTGRIPCGSCRADWRLWTLANPPPEPLTFEWTWQAHEAVNARLKKPAMPLDEAKRLWGM